METGTDLSQNASLGGRPKSTADGPISGASGTGATRSFLAHLINLGSARNSTASEGLRSGNRVPVAGLSDIEECDDEQGESKHAESPSSSGDRESAPEHVLIGQNSEEFIENESQ